MIWLWRGAHHPELPSIVKNAWEQNQLLVLCPPYLKDFSFLKYFAEVEFFGDWETKEIEMAQKNLSPSEQGILSEAILGVFTSGTQSGSPRLVFYSKKNILHSLDAIREVFDSAKIKKIFCYPQPTHTFGLLLGYVQSFLYQAQLVAPEGKYSSSSHQLWLEQHDQNTLTIGTPTHFIDLLNWARHHNAHEKIQNSYSCIIGGATVTQNLWRQVQSELKIISPSVGYGCTEASPGLTHLPPGQEPSQDGDVGPVLAGVKLQVLNNEVQFSAPNKCLAIFENNSMSFPELITLKDILIPQGKHFIFKGRSDLIMNRGGLKISLEHVENTISSYFSCKCLASGLPDMRLGQDVHLLIQRDQPLNKKDVIRLVEEKAAVRLSEENIHFEKIPVNQNMKFDRREARRLLFKRQKLNLPILVSDIYEFLPHREGAIWLDQMSDFSRTDDKGEVYFNPERAYSTNGHLRKSSCIEFVAQCHGYGVVLRDLNQMQEAPSGSHGFLVDIKNVCFYPDQSAFALEVGEKIEVQAQCTHDFGKFKIVKGQVKAREQVLSTMEMKIFII